MGHTCLFKSIFIHRMVVTLCHKVRKRLILLWSVLSMCGCETGKSSGAYVYDRITRHCALILSPGKGQLKINKCALYLECSRHIFSLSLFFPITVKYLNPTRFHWQKEQFCCPCCCDFLVFYSIILDSKHVTNYPIEAVGFNRQTSCFSVILVWLKKARKMSKIDLS